MTKDEINITESIKAEALRLGFSACGVAKAEPVDIKNSDAFVAWIDNGDNASMDYMSNNCDKRLNPLILFPEAKSIISLALNYYPQKRLSKDQYQFAYYAYGRDYHDVMKAMMQTLVEKIRDLFRQYENKNENNGIKYKLCCDTVPILDRYWAWKAGLGWIGKNTNLIIPKSGSFFFLCEIIIDKELDYDSPMEKHCGDCRMCLEACPTGALSEPYKLNANRCLSYLTIENRADKVFPESQDQKTSTVVRKNIEKEHCTYIYGCDRCQLACPYNKFAKPTSNILFMPSETFLSMRPSDWRSLSVEAYRKLFKGSAVKRAKYEGLMRNIRDLG